MPLRVDAAPIVAFLATCETHEAPHVRTNALGYAGYKPQDVLRAPALIELFNHVDILGLVQSFLGFEPCLYSVNAWWSYSSEHRLWHQNQFHRDIDEAKFLCLFVYLTDVDEEAGPHQIIPDSLQDGVNGCGTEFDAMIEKAFEGRIQTICGPAGTVFLANTLALHRGLPPKSKPRLMAWARYGSGPNRNSADLEMEPIELPGRLPDTPRMRSVNRLLVKFP